MRNLKQIKTTRQTEYSRQLVLQFRAFWWEAYAEMAKAAGPIHRNKTAKI